MYSSLLECRLNILLNHPQEYRHIPINGEPHITNNGVSVKQEWSIHLNLDSIIDKNGNFEGIDAVKSNRKPYEYEFNALKRVTKDFLDIYSSGRLGANKGRRNRNECGSEEYNVYGRLVTKRKRGCSYFYSLLNTHSKTDGWVKCCIKMESEAENEGLDWECDEYEIIKIVKQVNKTPYLNRLKQFFLHLLRNNLFFGKTKYDLSPTCVI